MPESPRPTASPLSRAAASVAAGLLVLLVGAASPAPAGAPPDDPPRIPEAGERERLLRGERARWERALREKERRDRDRVRGPGRNSLRADGEEAFPAAAPQGAAAGVDALHYTLDLEFDHPNQTITGQVSGQYEVLNAGMTTLVLDLYDDMVVSDVTLGATSLSFTHAGAQLSITLDRPYAAGEILDVTVAYSGVPASAGFGAFVWSSHATGPVFWSLSEPTYGPVWWPSVDDPADKVTAEMIFTVQSGLAAVSNGVLLSTRPVPGNKTEYHWRTTYPIAPYLISIACSNYSTFTDSYTPQAGGSPMELSYWVYPQDLSDAQIDFAVTKEIMNTYAQIFGEYPFIDEKYGMAAVGFGGAMEHQTATSYGASLITGTNVYDWINAHEVAHQWWGDSLTLVEWPDIWTHEGFATYSEALWFETVGGPSTLQSYMAGLDSGPFTGPVYDNPSLFGRTVYDKGGWVLHMLRHVMGDPAFFQLLYDYHAQHKYVSTSTPLFQAAAEAEHGQDLSWFFNQWVYGTGRPTYEWGWTAADQGIGWKVFLRIDQVQAGQSFSMPLDVTVQTTGAPQSFTVFSQPGSLDFGLAVLDEPTGVILDPDGWVLHNQTEVALPDGDGDGVYDAADNCPALHNPQQPDLDGDGLGDDCDPDIDGDGAANGSDCSPLDGTVIAPPDEVATLDLAGSTFTWSSLAAQAGDGVRYDLITGEAGDLPADGDISSAACRAGNITGTSFSDGQSPSPGQVSYSLVRGRNSCGTGSFGAASSGSPRVNAGCP